MNFDLPPEIAMIRDTVHRFAVETLRPHEPLVLRREAERGFTDTPLLPPEIEAELHVKARDIGLYGIDVPEEFGGQDLGALTKCVVIEQLKHSIVPFVAPPDSPNLHLLQSLCRGDQVERYFLPYARGEKRASLALTEPAAGSDAGAIRTSAERRNGRWILNGTKSFISHARAADFLIVIAVTDPAKRNHGGMTAFLVDKDAPGLSIPSIYPMIGEYCPYEVVLDNVELGDEHVLGEVGDAFGPLQRRLGLRRMEIAARCLGFAARCIEMMIEQANSRSTFGRLLADRQTIQWWIADSWQELEMARLLTYRLATRLDRGDGDLRTEASMVKIQGTEMITRVIDRTIQAFGGMGVSKELPLEYIYRVVRVYRIVEGPSEIHRWVIARDLLKHGQPSS
ncbi:(R)-benzylsuccinyl-CoA dehydrogenase [Rhodoligotrophos appendicifer]|uniref:acyl-CoA dehydrogenase family protein n=1 Tax=Rhodoligotrophos appendicifer TaxID=987056 RepID=UPI001184A1A4|nr:acyl-CoA dehydrogenase family protein [Rhodoligotrophos appendicifer]